MGTLLEGLGDLRDDALWLALGVGGIAWLVVVRTFPQATFGSAGAGIGAAVGVPVGYAWFDTVWLAAVAVTTVIGAAIGATGGAWVGARRRRLGRAPTLASSVVGAATACGMVGAYGTGYVVAFVRDGPPDFDLVSCFAGVVGGAAGWALGTVLGASLRHRTTAAGGEVAALIALVFAAVTLGAQIALGIRSASFGPMIDEVGPRNPNLPILETAAWIGTALVVVTFAVLAYHAAVAGRSDARGSDAS